MADVVDRAQRSRMMSGIRAGDTQPELRVRRFLHRRGLRFRLHVRTLPGRPDIVLPRYQTVVFVNGCFWHAHEGCRFAFQPKTNVDFWKEKFARTRQRDAEVGARLRSARWLVLTVWECQLSTAELSGVAGKIRRNLRARSPARGVRVDTLSSPAGLASGG